MFNKIKKELYFYKRNLLITNGIYSKKIVPFDDDFYEQLSHTFINGLPVSMQIKYLKPILPPGKCYDRSLYMFFCLDDALLVRGDEKNLELLYGKDNAGHGWIERGNYVYDPTSLMRFDKDLYYKIFQPTNISKKSIEQYCLIDDCRELYEDIHQTTIEDYQPNGRKRIDLYSLMPLVEGIAEGNQEFKSELETYLASIQYDRLEIKEEIKEKLKKINYY